MFQHCSNDLSSCIILSYISQEGPSNGTAARDVEAAAPHQGHGGGGHDHEEVGCFFFFKLNVVNFHHIFWLNQQYLHCGSILFI